MNQLRSINFPIGILGAFLLLLCLKFPVWGIITLERKLDTYPVVSRETVAMLDQMASTLAAFDQACQDHQAGKRDALNGVEAYREGYVYATPEDLIRSATAEMYMAVARRKALAREADWSLLKSMLIGGQAYTHSTWLCAPAYASFTTQINVGFTPTYDPAS